MSHQISFRFTFAVSLACSPAVLPTLAADCAGIGGTSSRAGRLQTVEMASLPGWEVVKERAAGSSQGYTIDEVRTFYEDERERLLNALGGPNLAGPRVYAEVYFPTFSATPLASGASQFLYRSAQPESTGPRVSERFDHLTPKHEVTGLAESIESFQQVILNACHQIDLNIQSDPDRATFNLSTQAGGSAHETTTNDSMRVYRGLYSYSVQKTGYKPIVSSLNLVDDRGTELDCELVPVSRPERAYPCRLH